MNINGRPVQRAIARAELGGLLSHLADSWGTAIRIEAHQADGSIHADILTPQSHLAHPTPNPQQPDPRLDTSSGADQPTGLTADGLMPGEPVHIAVVIQTATADQTGRLVAPVPRRPRRYRSAAMLTHGQQSGATRIHPAP